MDKQAVKCSNKVMYICNALSDMDTLMGSGSNPKINRDVDFSLIGGYQESWTHSTNEAGENLPMRENTSLIIFQSEFYREKP